MRIFKKILFGVAKVLAIYVLIGLSLWLHGMEIIASVATSGKAKNSRQKISRTVGKKIERGAQLGRKEIKKAMMARTSGTLQKVWRYI